MTRWLAGVVLVLLLAPVAACGGGGSDTVDAGVDAGGITPPAPPALPALTPCPTGWREVAPVDADDVATCDPWPQTGAADCLAPDEAHFPGEPGCARVGSACPAGEWADGLPAGTPILYVRAGGAPGGNGSMATPYGTIAAAMAVATPGTILALGKGTFDEIVTIGSGVTLWGACVAMTHVASSAPSSSNGTLTTTSVGAAAKNLTVGGERPGVFLMAPSATLDLEDVVVADTKFYAVFVSGATVTAHGLVVRDTRPRSDLLGGRGLTVQDGAQVTIGRAVLARNNEAGAFVGGVGTNLTLTDAAVLDTRASQVSGGSGFGIDAAIGGHVELARVVLERNLTASVFVTDPGTTVVLTDIVVRDTASRAASMDHGHAIAVQLGAHADVTRALLERNRAITVAVAGASATLTDVVARDTAAIELDGTRGRGLEASMGAQVAVTRALFARNREFAVFVEGANTVADLTDLVVRDTQSELATLGFGIGLAVHVTGRVTVNRALFERNRDVGVLALEGTNAILADVVVRDTRSREMPNIRGRGFAAQDGAYLEITRGLSERNRDVGVVAFDAGTIVQLSEFVVVDTLEQECAATSTCLWDVSSGIGALRGAAINATRFAVSGGALCGVQLAEGGTIDLHDGEVFGNPIGANVQTADFDVTRLQDGVIFRDNVINLDATLLPVPEP